MVHALGPDGKCLGCIAKLEQANAIFTPWFWQIRVRFPDLHISWTFRDEASQNQAVAEGNSKLKWPDSAHNKMVDGKPCSDAVDLFEIYNNEPFWHPGVMAQIAELSPQFLWGAHFKSLGDYDHFQIKEPW
jgi:hypothetical protein